MSESHLACIRAPLLFHFDISFERSFKATLFSSIDAHMKNLIANAVV